MDIPNEYGLSDKDAELIIPRGEAAVITAGGMTKLELLVPDLTGNPDTRVPSLLLYLTACMVRGNRDQEFVEEMIDWFTDATEDA